MDFRCNDGRMFCFLCSFAMLCQFMGNDTTLVYSCLKRKGFMLIFDALYEITVLYFMPCCVL